MIRGLDHLVVVVPDLDAAIEAYRRAGFLVEPGGRHAGEGTGNALIGLADGCYIELFAFLAPTAASPRHSLWPVHQRGGGLAGYWFTSGDLDGDLAGLERQGASYSPARAGSRERTDGFVVRFRLATPEAGSDSFLPRLIEDVTPRGERAPAFGGHDNGVRAIAAVRVMVPDLARARALFGAMLGGPAAEQGRMLEFRLGEASLHLVEPGTPEAIAATGARGWGIESIDLATAAGVRSIDASGRFM